MVADGFLGMLGFLGSPLLFGVLLSVAAGLAWLAFAPARPAQQVQDRLQGYLERVQAVDDAELQRFVRQPRPPPRLPQSDSRRGPAGAPKEHGRDAGDAGAGGRAGRPDRAGLRRRPAPGDGRAGRRRAAGARRPVRAVECAAVCGTRRHIRIHGARLLAALEDQEATARSPDAPCPMRWICSPSAWRRAWRSSRRSCGWASGGTTRCRASSAVPWRRCGWG